MSLAATLQIVCDALSDPGAARADRRPVNSVSTVRLADGVARDVMVEDLSATGCKLEHGFPLSIGTRVRLGLSGAGAIEGEVVRLLANGSACAFDTPLDGGRLAAAFGGDAVLRGRFAASVAGEPHVDKWSLPVRGSLILGAGAGAWLFGLIALRALLG